MGEILVEGLRDKLWTVRDVAEYLRVSTSLVYKKSEAGLLPCVRMGPLVRFEPDEVRRWALRGFRQVKR